MNEPDDEPENESGAWDAERRAWEEEHDPEYLIWLDFINNRNQQEQDNDRHQLTDL